MTGLLRAIERVYRDGSVGILTVAADRLRSAVPEAWGRRAGIRKPVGRFVGQAVALGRLGPLADVANGFAMVEPDADWLQNPNYSAAAMGAGFVDRYGYVELVGPGRPVESRDLLVGLLLLGPQTHYPDHAHQAEEVYHVVAGRADWWRDGGGWQVREAGAVIHHAPLVRHAMRTGAEPLLALYCWAGRVEVPAQVTGGAS